MKFIKEPNLHLKKILWSLFIALILFLFFQIGGHFQIIFLNIIIGDANNLHDLLNSQPTQTYQILDFSEFLFIFNWAESLFYFFIIFIPTYIALKDSKIKKLILNLIIAIFISYTLIDICYNITNKNEISIIKTIFSNLLGGILISCITATFVYLSTIINTRTLKTTTQISIFIFLNILLFFIFYLILINVFKSSTTKIKAELNPNFSLDYAISKNSIESKISPFGIQNNKELKLNNFEYFGYSDIKISYKYDNESNFKVSLYEGCLTSKTEDLIKIKNKNFDIDGKNILIHLDKGGTFFKGYKQNNILFNDYITVSNLHLSKISNDTFKASYFLSQNSDISVLSNNNKDYYRFDLILLNDLGGTKRKIDIKNLQKKISFTIDKKLNPDLFPICTPIKNLKENNVLNNISITLLIETSKSKYIDDLFKKSELSISKMNGWFYGNDLTNSNLSEYINNGTLDFLSIEGSFKSLYVNNEKVEVNTKNHLYLTNGKIQASLHDGYLSINADIKNGYFDNDRISKTRWEQTSVYIKFLLGSFGAVLILIFRKFLIILKENPEIL